MSPENSPHSAQPYGCRAQRSFRHSSEDEKFFIEPLELRQVGTYAFALLILPQEFLDSSCKA
jgi:hypothetical protein